MRRLTAGVLGMLCVLLAPAGARAQTQPALDKDAAVILVGDASKSMRSDDGSGQPKIAAAKSALNTLVDELQAKVGLRVSQSGMWKISGSKPRHDGEAPRSRSRSTRLPV